MCECLYFFIDFDILYVNFEDVSVKLFLIFPNPGFRSLKTGSFAQNTLKTGSFQGTPPRGWVWVKRMGGPLRGKVPVLKLERSALACLLRVKHDFGEICFQSSFE